MLKRVVGAVIGTIAAFAAVAAVEFVSAFFVPLSSTTGLPAEQWVASVPLAKKIAVVAAWAFGAFLGAIAAARIGKGTAIGWVPPILVAAAGIANVTMIFHPIWMSIAAFMAPMLGGWLGTRLARPRP